MLVLLVADTPATRNLLCTSLVTLCTQNPACSKPGRTTSSNCFSIDISGKHSRSTITVSSSKVFFDILVMKVAETKPTRAANSGPTSMLLPRKAQAAASLFSITSSKSRCLAEPCETGISCKQRSLLANWDDGIHRGFPVGVQASTSASASNATQGITARSSCSAVTEILASFLLIYESLLLHATLPLPISVARIEETVQINMLIEVQFHITQYRISGFCSYHMPLPD